MAYVNVMEWRAEQVAEWLQGVDDSIFPYAQHFLNNNVTGQGLLNLSVTDLYKLRVEKIGHQEIIREALEQLKNLHEQLHTENLQFVCLRLSCRARSLCNEIRMYGPDPNEVKQTVTTSIMNSVADVLDSLWTLISWLRRPPFVHQDHYRNFSSALLETSTLMAISSFRDRFAEKPVNIIRDCCDRLAGLADTLITQVGDALIITPATLEMVTTKRKADEADFGIVFEAANAPSSPIGTHVVAEVKFGSFAAIGGKIEPGDEVVQVNYQTVVGWQTKKMLRLMEENPSELILTLKKRPRHSPSNLFGMKPFPIPSRKKKNPPNHFNNLPSPRVELLVAPSIAFPSKKLNPRSGVNMLGKHVPGPTVPDVPDDPASKEISPTKVERRMSLQSPQQQTQSEGDDEDFEDDELGVFSSDDETTGQDDGGAGQSQHRLVYNKSPTQSIRSVLSRPRSAPQRRNTISGGDSQHYKAYINLSEIWQHLKKDEANEDNSTTTLRSRDSGHSTMSSTTTSYADNQQLQKEQTPPPPPKQPPRPTTMAQFISQPPPPSILLKPPSIEDSQPAYMNLPESSRAALTAAANAARATARAQQQQVKESSPSKSHAAGGGDASNPNSASKKRPIPQPRNSISRNNSKASIDSANPASPTHKDSLTRSLKNLLPDVMGNKSPHQVFPQPTANFKSYKRVPVHTHQQNAPNPSTQGQSPPVVPARSTPRKSPAELPPKKYNWADQDNIPLPTSAPPPRPDKPQDLVHLRQKQREFSPSHRHGFVEETPEKKWMDNLRRREETEEPASSALPPVNIPPRLPQRSPAPLPPPPPPSSSSSSQSRLRNVHEYQHLSQEQQPQQLKYAFDMELKPQKDSAAQTLSQEYTEVKEDTDEENLSSPTLPPLFKPTSYTFKDFKSNNNEQK